MRWTAADLRLRLRQALAWRGAELGELTASHRLVHLLAHHPRLSVLYRYVAVAAAAGVARAADRRHAGRRRLGNRREFELDHRALPLGDNIAGLFWRQHRQLGLRHAIDGDRLSAGAEA